MNNPLSRRRFLQFAGLSMVRLRLNWLKLTPESLMGRALGPVELYSRPADNASIISTLWPDSVHKIVPLGDWLRVEDGFAPITAFQPMMANESVIVIERLPAWVEVIAPYVAVRQYCAGDAPIYTRVGHGGVLYIDKRLQGAQDWLHVPQLDGWLQAHHVRLARFLPDIHHSGPPRVVLNNGHLEAREGDQTVLRLKCRVSSHLPSELTIIDQRPSDRDGEYYGVPWILDGGKVRISGVYWHHELAGESAPSDRIELSVIGARALYNWAQGANQSILFQT